MNQPPPTILPGSSTRSSASPLVIVGRLLLLLVAALAAASAFTLVGRDDGAARGSLALHVCPMHPEVTSPGPDDCSICGMALERASRARPRNTDPDVFSLPELANPEPHKLVARPERRVFAEEVWAPAWLDTSDRLVALLYREELAGLLPGERATFFPAARPDEAVDVQLAADAPVAWDRSTSRVSFRVAPGGPALDPGGVGWLELAARRRELLVVPSRALVNSREGPHVLAVSADGRSFTRRPVDIGRASRGFTVVLAGLRDDEAIVVGYTFFVDAERRLQAQAEAVTVPGVAP